MALGMHLLGQGVSRWEKETQFPGPCSCVSRSQHRHLLELGQHSPWSSSTARPGPPQPEPLSPKHQFLGPVCSLEYTEDVTTRDEESRVPRDADTPALAVVTCRLQGP